MDWLTSRSITINGAEIPVGAMLIGLAIILIGLALASRLSKQIRGPSTTEAPAPRWRATIAQVVGHIVRILAVSVALQFAGVNIGSLLAASAVVAVGVGIAMQKVAENFVSGVILMAERSIREGDIIEFAGQVARVRSMGIRATVAQTLDDEEIIVPNSILTQSPVKNLTLEEPIHRLRVTVGLSYGSDITLAETTLRGAVEGLSWRVKTRPPIVLLLDFGSSSVDFEVSIWTADVWGLRRGQSEMRKAIWHALKAANLTIPFPQVDVHFDRGEGRTVVQQ